MTTTPATQQEPSRSLQPAAPPVGLSAEQLRFHASPSVNFRSTEELEPPGHDFIGQERARAALELGIGITGGGFNVFVSGLSGVERLEALQEWIAARTAQVATPGDWVYVHNFA
ncbi:MAG: hypothetical protein AB1671_23320, partial [Thermodesulfobacteriota bacterium]